MEEPCWSTSTIVLIGLLTIVLVVENACLFPAAGCFGVIPADPPTPTNHSTRLMELQWRSTIAASNATLSGYMGPSANFSTFTQPTTLTDWDSSTG